MDIDFSVSPDTQVVLLLCGALGRNDRSVAPLTPGQYNVFALALDSIGKRPADLIGSAGSDECLIRQACSAQIRRGNVEPADSERVLGLLRRGLALSTALDKWSSYGVKVVSRADEIYPEKLRTHLGVKAPALLYYAGNAALLSGGGMAFVGARDISEEASEMIRTVVRGCVDLGMNIVSGGARGADQTAMQEASSVGGKVIGALPCDLLKTCLDPLNREALADDRALLFSAFDPEVRPFSYGPVAMARNKYIYGMADACFVAQSGIGAKSGTWSGAEEELSNKNRNPVYVYFGTNPSEGCVKLAGMGAVVWDAKKTVAENLSNKSVQKQNAQLVQDELISMSNTAKVIVQRSESKEHKEVFEESYSPYDLFLERTKELLSAPRKETEVKKRLGNKLDLVVTQVKHWLEKAVRDGIVVRKEYPHGKKTCAMLELAR